MQITFDPLNKQEADFVARIVYSGPIIASPLSLSPEQIEIIARSLAVNGTLEPLPVIDHTLLPHADLPTTGAESPSAAPLPPDAPSFAAVDLFPNVPAAAAASVPPAPPVPSPPAVAAPPVPPAPSAPASPERPAPAGELDKNGLPWDERIHASTKAKNADGSWRQRRSLNDDALLKRVEAELRSKVAAPLVSPGVATAAAQDGSIPNPTSAPVVVPSAPPAPSAATVVVPPPPATPAGPSVVPAPPVPAGVSSIVPTAPPAAPPASTRGPLSFGDMMSKLITRNIAAGLLKEEQVHAVMARPGVELQPTQIGVLAGDAFKRQLVVDGLRELNLPEE